MKPARREWALIAAFFLFMIFIYSQYAFMIGADVNLQKMGQVHVLSTVGMLLGALLFPLLLPLGNLRKRLKPSRYTLRLVIVGLFFLPQIIVRLMGPQAWLANSFNFRFMALGNGLVATLMFGCIFTLTGKYRVFWAALALSAGFFWYNLVLGPGRELLPYTFTFAAAGITLTAAGVLLLVFLAGLCLGSLGLKSLESHTVVESRAASQGEASPPPIHAKVNAGRFDVSCIFPILAALVIFWPNSFTDKLFSPTLNINFSPGFNLSQLVQIVAVPVFGFLACLWWRRFLGIFIPLCSFLFLLSPCLLFLSHSYLLFLVLYTLHVTAMRMIIVVFPFVIVDLYWQKPRGGYWSWLLAVSIYLIDANALVLTGPFKSISLEDGYAVALLSLAATAFFVLSLPVILPKPKGAAGATAESTPDIAGIFRKHNLSERETEVALLLVGEGLSNEEMGERLFISPSTIKSHVSQIYKKFGVKKRAEFLAKVLNK